MVYEQYLNVIDQKAETVFDVSDGIWDHAELPFREYQSMELLAGALENEGFTVERGVGKLPTAFKATYGSGKPAMGILAEYDALSGLNQAAGATEPLRIAGADVGHGCGHNLFAGGSFAAALAVKAYIEETGKGSITLFGCPAEEGGSGKVFMVREGVFDGIDAVVSWHPEKMYMVRTRPALANTKVSYAFTGIAAHAGGSPHKGRSALDAVELMNVGCNYLREHMETTSRIHYAITDSGGMAPNVVQAHAVIKYEVRAPKTTQAQELFTRVVDVAKGAALMTGTKMQYEITMAFSDYVPNKTLGVVVDEAMRDLGAPDWTEEDFALAAEFLRTYPRTTMVGIKEHLQSYFDPDELEVMLKKPLHSDIYPFNPKENAYMSGSTDVGDVGYATPTVMFNMATACLGNVGHSWQNTALSCSPLGMKGTLRAAEALVLASVRTIEQPELIEKAKAELIRKNGGKYICPLPEYVVPPIGKY